MFKMLVEHFKQSESSAHRHLQAMRLMKDVPEAKESLESCEVNLTTLSMAQSQIRKEEKLTGKKMSIERKTAIVERVKNKTQAETEVELFLLMPETASAPGVHEKRISADEVE